ncbi:MAG: hypothetical protein OXE80_01260, partial [Gammaproteobacteria bacterium]|nr:hypothetical protein [Gammaproteobacteria bacterium]
MALHAVAQNLIGLLGSDPSLSGGGECCGRREYVHGIPQNIAHAIHGAALPSSTAPVSASMSSRSALEKRCFWSASQTGQPAFWQAVLAIHGATLLASTGPGLDILSSRSALEKRCFSSA